MKIDILILLMLLLFEVYSLFDMTLSDVRDLRVSLFFLREKNANMLVFFVMIGIKVLILLMFKLGLGNPTLVIIKKFFAMSKIECMTTGGIGAFFLFKYP